MLGRFLIADVVHKAVQKNLDSVRIESESLPLSMVQGLSEMGFTRFKDSFVRFCFTRYLERDDTLSRVAELLPESSSTYRNMSHLDLERHCSPLVSATNQKHFLIPIRQGYALNLVDRQRSSSELFGGDPELLLRWCNVYYRKVTHWRMLEEPGRILWYVSGDQKAIVAVSHLDKVVIDTPKKLFRKFKEYGTLEWDDLYRMCGGDISRKLMALQFSHSFSFRRPVSLDKVWAVFDEDGVGRSLQSPRQIPFSTFRKLFQLGYPS